MFIMYGCLKPMFYNVLIQGDQKVSVHLTITVQKHAKIQYFKQFQSPTMDRAILNTVFENTVRIYKKNQRDAAWQYVYL